MTKSISSKVFVLLFALALLGAGFLTINKTENIAEASTTTETAISNSTPEYFSAVDSGSSGLLDSNIFMYSATSENSLTLSFTVGRTGATGIYSYVYYPDPTDITTFMFFSEASTISLTINGEKQDVSNKTFFVSTGTSFDNQQSSPTLQTFEMVFNNSGSNSNEISLFSGTTLNEGLYELSLTFLLSTCTDGGTTMEEAQFSSETVTISYSFYVVSESSYFSNGRPVISSGEFDKEIEIQSTSDSSAYYLYSNYSSDAGVGSATAANKIPYIEYDATRYDVTIVRNLNSTLTTQSVKYDTTGTVLCYDSTGSEISALENMLVTYDSGTARIYFVDVGVYTLTFSAIQVVEIDSVAVKLPLDGITDTSKNVMVYMYGYQAVYADFDKERDENNSRQMSELKTVDTTTYTFTDSADITSSLIASDSDYSQANAGTTFLNYNVIEYINTAGENDGLLTPVTTNQKPVRFTTNATLVSSLSYVFTTKNITGYTESTYSLGTSPLYYKNFTGTTESTDATYIYVIAYTYNNYYSSEGTLASSQVFYQVFYFQINSTIPEITVKTESEDGSTVLSNKYYNTSIYINDDTKESDPYCKDVTVQIYAYNYKTNSYYTQFGGSSGISLSSILGTSSDGYYSTSGTYSILLEANAYYTIRLFYSSDSSTTISSMSFYIDKESISGLSARSATQATSSTSFQILTSFDAITNQSFVLSWNKKDSGASISAYYRYFSLVQTSFFPTSASSASSILRSMLNKSNGELIAVDSVLDLSSGSSWLPLASATGTGGNTSAFSNFSYVSSDYVLSDAGLYVIQLEDEAGNISYGIYLIDNTTPNFVLYDESASGEEYSLPSDIEYIKNPSTLHWGEYKAIYIKGLTSSLFTTTETVTASTLQSSGNVIYQNRSGECVLDLYTILKEFYTENLMQYVAIDDQYVSSEISGAGYITSSTYTSMYLTIEIEDVTYSTTTGTYSAQSGATSQYFSCDTEMTYSVLIRDSANTKQDYTNTSQARQYEYYYSAKQTIVVSFDSSELRLSYTDGNTSTDLVSYTSTTGVDTDGNSTKTYYFHPTSLEKAFSLSFVPTVEGDTSYTIQVSTVTIYYYAYETTSEVIDGITYYYTTLSSSYTEIPIYEYNGSNGQTTTLTNEVYVGTDGYTCAGKYVITRTYYVSDGSTTYSFNDNDVYSLSLVLYVDRYDVISSPETVGSGSTESLVGGDIFVSMFDSGTTADIVVTFPNSDKGNTDGQSLFNSATSSSSVKTAITTNKLPVNVYIPVFKFTQSVIQVEDADGYHFEVVSDRDMNAYYSTKTTTDGVTTTNYTDIKEYILYAEIYNGDTSNPNNLIAATSTERETAISDYASNNGFLKFYSKSSAYSESTGLTTAGEYYVVVYQGYFGEEHSSTNAFDQSIIFKFVIEKATPDFTATTSSGSTLNSESADSTVSEIYYTNESDIILTWDAATDDYSVEIDLDAIEVVAVNSSGSTTYSSSDGSLSWKSDSDGPKLSSSQTYYYATLSLETLGVYENGGYVDITMQFKNHSSYYTKVSKRIYVDLVSPYTNINSLLSTTLAANSVASIGLLTEANLRTYQTAKGSSTTSYASASYNLSNSSSDGYFAYYSYQVESTFLTSLQSVARQEALTNTSGTVQYLTYIREVSDKYTSASTITQEATPSTFNSNEYSVVGGTDSTLYLTALNTGTYYEIVESDKAGNMTIYTIYVVDKTSTDTILLSATSTSDPDAEPRTYTAAEYQQAEKDNTTKTLFLRTGYALDTINYFGDEWAIIRLTTYGSNNSTTVQTLVLSPTQSGYAYEVSGTTMTLVSISSLIDSTFSTTNKHIMEIYDRSTGTWDTLFVSVYNTTLSASLSSSTSEEYITFTQPISSYLTNENAKSTVFLKELAITITLSDSSQTIVIYGAQNGDDIEYVTNLTGLATNWTATANTLVSVSVGTTSVTFTLDLSSYGAGTKVKYYYVDNFGREYVETHIYGETVISQAVTTTDSNLYSYLNEDGETVYITETNLSYTYNAAKNAVVVYNTSTNERSDSSTYSTSNGFSVSGYTAKVTHTNNSDGTTTVTLTAKAEYTDGYKTSKYDQIFAFLIFDEETYNSETSTVDDCDKKVLFRLYDQLPTVASSSSMDAGQFRIIDSNTNDITGEILGLTTSSDSGYYSEVRILYSLDSTIAIPVVYSISTDGVEWEEVTSGTRLRNNTDEMITYYLKIWYQEDYLENTYGRIWSYVFQNVPDEQIFTFNLSSLTATYWVEKTVDGVTEVVQRSGSTYEYNGSKYSNHYTVNLTYSMSAANEDAPVRIRVNQEYGLDVKSLGTIVQNGVTSEILQVYTTEGSSYSLTYTVVISFIPASDNFVSAFYLSGLNGSLEETNYISSTSATLYVTEEYTSLDTVRLQWSKYYGIKENPVQIYITKEDGSTLSPKLYSTSDSSGEYYYTYLTYSGKYSIMLKDTAGNIQKFSSGSKGQSEIFTLTFFKDVPFNLTYTDLDENEITTLPTTQAVFNSSVTLTIPSTLLSLFYGYPSISVTKNGEEYDGEFSSSATSFTFSEAGYYEVTLSAKLTTGEQLRSETYQFTIVSSDEHKISYVLNKYSNYYIESVVKDGTDVTATFLTTLSTDTIVVDGTERLASLSISYLDEKTGSGVYEITVNSNSALYSGTDSDVLTSWTYQLTINQGTAPIKISVSEGESTTSNITITYNAENMFAELGNSVLRIMKLSDSGSLSIVSEEINITSESTGQSTITITGTGTFFVQVVSASGNLLFSYKVIKNEAMNAATIIIIVLAVILTLVVLVIIFRLRKRISVK